jgi:AraC family transcriptional regulator of adaptative response/methylated-DNA-[protein]-cysteine methyltransferase
MTIFKGRKQKSLTMTTQTSDTAEPETLRLGYADSVLGTIAVAVSTHGIVALFVGDDRTKLLQELKDAFPGTTLVPDQTGLAQILAKAATLLEAPHLGSDLPLDLRGSPLELAVWKALQEIPAGETRTYGAIAQNLPMKATAQEVGAACAASRIAVAVPCHRVVKSDGSISGYRWGVQRKRRLINMEGVA